MHNNAINGGVCDHPILQQKQPQILPSWACVEKLRFLKFPSPLGHHEALWAEAKLVDLSTSVTGKSYKLVFDHVWK